MTELSIIPRTQELFTRILSTGHVLIFFHNLIYVWQFKRIKLYICVDSLDRYLLFYFPNAALTKSQRFNCLKTEWLLSMVQRPTILRQDVCVPISFCDYEGNLLSSLGFWEPVLVSGIPWLTAASFQALPSCYVFFVYLVLNHPPKFSSDP